MEEKLLNKKEEGFNAFGGSSSTQMGEDSEIKDLLSVKSALEKRLRV